MSELSLYVGITTLPSRIDMMRPAVESLLKQRRLPDKIFISLPEESIREACGYTIPPWLETLSPRIEIVRCPIDYGPGTKLMGCLPMLSDDGCLVLADDDTSYQPGMLETLYNAYKANPHAAHSFYVYSIGRLRFGVGAFGFAIPISALKDVDTFAQHALNSPHLFVTDDQWISLFLQNKGISIIDMLHNIPDDEGVFYGFPHNINQLRQIEGETSRKRAVRKGIFYLFKTNTPSWHLRWRFYATLLEVAVKKVYKNIRKFI